MGGLEAARPLMVARCLFPDEAGRSIDQVLPVRGAISEWHTDPGMPMLGRFKRSRRALATESREAISKMGIDGRTCYFAGIVRQKNLFKSMYQWAGLRPGKVEHLLREFLSERYVTYVSRGGMRSDMQPLALILSQGYKRGLEWRGLPLGKTCYDICIYQQMIQDLQPRSVIELGTGLGASALFLADTCRSIGVPAKVVTLDRNADAVSEQVFDDESIEFIAGDVKDISELLTVEKLTGLPHPWLIIEDCHVHLQGIIDHLFPLMAADDYLVIEDIGHQPGGGRIIRKAIESLPAKSLMVDTFYTDLFGRNATCSPDSIFRKFA